MTEDNYWDSTGSGSQEGASPMDHSAQPTQAFRSGTTDAMPAVNVQESTSYRASSSPQPQQGYYQYGQATDHSQGAAAKAAKGGSALKTFLFGFLGALVACALALGGFGAWQSVQNKALTTDNTPKAEKTVGTSDPSVINAIDEGQSLAEAVAAKALPSVAYIGVYTSQSGAYGLYGYTQGNSSSSELVESALGSGIVLSDDGYILTNYHVVEGAEALKVVIEGNEYDAEIVGTDESSDLAVIKAVDASGLTAADIGDSDSLVVGEWVMSVGCPFGLEQSVATGVVSATSRSRVVESSSSNGYYNYGQSASQPTLYPNMIQTDAAINPGNSGGALVDSDGKVIGVNTLIASYSGNYSGVGFAIPINYAINIAQQIIDGKTPTHAKLGVSLTNVTSSIAKRYDLPVDYGAYVTDVSAGSGADQGGITAGDIIIAFDGTKISTATDLTLQVRAHNPGDTVAITVNREGQEMKLDVTLGSDENELAAQSTPDSGSAQQNPLGGNGSNGGQGNGNGYNGQNLSYEDILRYFGLL